MQRAQLSERLSAIRQWRSGDVRAPHKPLVLLRALARVQRGRPRLERFEHAEEPVRHLLEDFGPARSRHRPEYPFWRLRSDGLWELDAPAGLELSASGDPRLGDLRTARGGFPPEIHRTLADDPSLVAELAQQLLDQHFPPSIHGDVLAAVGLAVRRVGASTPPRDPDFRRSVLEAYTCRCAMCGYDARLDDATPVAIDAAHIRWFSHDGPDEVANGLALCALHHRALDRGVVGVDPRERTIVVSRRVVGGPRARSLLSELHGRPIAAPAGDVDPPDRRYLDWHRRQVFRGGEPTARAAAADGTGDYDP